MIADETTGFAQARQGGDRKQHNFGAAFSARLPKTDVQWYSRPF
jgi:hypothetical protein